MTQHHHYLNGDARAEDSDSDEGEELAEELSVRDEGGPARALQALNQLRKSRQHYDAVLVAGGVEVAAHRAVLAAASPYLLRALEPAGAPPVYRVEGVEPDALRELVEYAYTGRARARDPPAARALYRAAWRLRVEPVRAHLAAALLRRLTPADCLELRALPDLDPHHLEALDAYIAQNFEAVCESGALAALPVVRIELLREERAVPMGAGAGAEGAGRAEDAPQAVADAALAWLRDRAPRHDLEELCSRVHLLYVDGAGALRDCGELPASGDDAPELREYRREAEQRARRGAGAAGAGAGAARPPPGAGGGLELGGERAARGECAVLAARAAAGGGGGARALLAVRGRLASARVAWRDVGAGGATGTRAALGEGGAGAGRGRRARLGTGRCAHGAAALAGRLVVCGGYDRARVLRTAEAYDPSTNTWSALAEMRGPRARFPAAALRGALYAAGGSDGQTELDSLGALEGGAGGAWAARARLPLALSHAAAVADESAGVLYLLGGWAAGRNLKQVLCYSPDTDKWTEMPALTTGRSQCAAVVWGGALWALGGCDAWHCLASTERLALGGAGAGGAGAGGAGAAGEWAAGPALPTARRSMGGVSWRGRLVSAGGSDGAASLRRVEWLEAGAGAWRGGPDLRRARAALGLVELDGALYAVAGFDGKEFLSCIECLYDPDGEWTELYRAESPRRPLTPPPPPPPADPEERDGGRRQE